MFLLFVHRLSIRAQISCSWEFTIMMEHEEKRSVDKFGKQYT